MKNKIALLLAILLIGSCGYYPNDTEIINKLNKALNIDTPNNFKLLNSSSSIAPGDYIEEFEIEYSKEEYKNFLNQINLKNWIKVEKGYQFIKPISEKAGVIISIGINDTKVRYQYGEI